MFCLLIISETKNDLLCMKEAVVIKSNINRSIVIKPLSGTVWDAANSLPYAMFVSCDLKPSIYIAAKAYGHSYLHNKIGSGLQFFCLPIS